MASTPLKSVAEIFNETIFRIPDYQRGYAWGKKQREDFWEDLENLKEGQIHYTGVLTIESVEEQVFNKWEADTWLIGTGVKPFFIVDGQQRLTTIIILIQSILEHIKKGQKLNFLSKDQIIQKYIFTSKDEGISRSYIFGYDRDNPSYEFLKTKIFCENSNSNENIETLYTSNLENVKRFFKEKIKDLSPEDLGKLFKKVTTQLKFNVYEIDKDLDVFVAFETMNNRGKVLSKLELLKNRLIYLSTLLETNSNEKNAIRKNINECWKTIYAHLGRNKYNPLKDDEFLKNHWITYFKYSRETANDYVDFLLGQHFTAKKASSGGTSIKEIQNYVDHLQESVQKWYILFNPEDSRMADDLKAWLDKLNRIGYGAFAPLVMSILVKNEEKDETILELLKSMERYIFLIFKISRRRSNTGDSVFYGLARAYYKGEESIPSIINKINELTDQYLKTKEFYDYIDDEYKHDEGFYSWSAIRYFLYEYDSFLKEMSKTSNQKINWKEFSKSKKDYLSIEHIYPQSSNNDCWKKAFNKITKKEKELICNSLGNLLPLSIQKNSSLQNDCFDEKKRQKEGSVGYQYGSYSENEVAQKKDWNTKEILERGLKLLDFMEKRWKVILGSKNDKIKLLHLDFIKKTDN